MLQTSLSITRLSYALNFLLVILQSLLAMLFLFILLYYLFNLTTLYSLVFKYENFRWRAITS